uniref:Fibronectin type-III domain-containing protein n=1 Tax=Tetraodon nigroviridis TaxID=99883 RepID=H3BWZ8_TETNG
DLKPNTLYTFEVSAEFMNGNKSEPAATQATTDVESPKQIKVDHISHDSLSVCWTPPGGEVRNYTVACCKGQQIVQNLKTTETNITVTELEPDTLYILEVSAKFMNGKKSKPAKTQATTDVESPKQVKVYISHDSLSVCWTPPGGEVKNYTLTCRKGQQIVQNLTTTDTNITVTDLNSGTSYNLEVCAEFVNGKISKPASTQATTDVESPKQVQVNRTSHDSLSVCWAPPGGEVSNYTVTCSKGQQVVQNLKTRETNITVRDLEPDTCYTLEVSAVFLNKKISKPASTEATTDVESPKQMGVYRISHDSLSVCWAPPGGEVRNYTVTCRKGEEVVKLKLLTTTETNIRVTDLDPGTCYTLEVSDDGSPKRIQVDHTSHDSLSVCWTPP